ncbi:hypothetical protein JXM83_04895 [Candidatus Woesearchaeota archaeon]|nr:hypothetical protein [Candidatus Woesearchaeota archaeon]
MNILNIIFHRELLEIRRQFLHLILGLIFSFLILIGKFDVTLFTFILVFSIAFSFISKKTYIPVVTFFLDYFDRPSDIRIFPGKGFITFLIGSLGSVIVFELLLGNRLAAFIAVLSLTIGDSMSTIYGHSFGKIQNPFNKRKTVEGMIFALLFLSFALLLVLPWYIAIVIGIVAAFVETLEVKIFGKVVDDNIYLPLIVGSIMILFGVL